MNSIWFWILWVIAYTLLIFVVAYLFGTWASWGRDNDD